MSFRRTHLPDFLILGQEQWDQIERRNQLLIRALAARNPSAGSFRERALRPRELRQWRWPQPVPVGQNLWKVQLIRPLSDQLSQRLSDRAEAYQALRAARLVGLHRPLLWSQDPQLRTSSTGFRGRVWSMT